MDGRAASGLNGGVVIFTGGASCGRFGGEGTGKTLGPTLGMGDPELPLGFGLTVGLGLPLGGGLEGTPFASGRPSAPTQKSAVVNTASNNPPTQFLIKRSKILAPVH